MKKIFSVICVLLVLLMLTGCAHPWRIAPDPNAQNGEIDASNATPIPFESVSPTEAPETASPALDTAAPDTETPYTDVLDTETPSPEPTASETDHGTELPTEVAGTPGPAGTPTTAPSNMPSAMPTTAPTNAPTAAPTATPTPTPKPTAAPTPQPSPTPKPADIPPFAGQTINGHGTITNSIFATCRVTMVNVWATTCAPCVAEMPHIQQLANNYAGSGLKVISVLGDSEQPGCIQQGLNIINGINFTLPVMRNKADVAAAFPAGAYPMTYFIDSNGNILRVESTSHSYDEWVSIVNRLLG